MREERGLYQRQIASNLEISRHQVYTWEEDKYAAPVSKIVELFGKAETHRLMGENQLRYKVGVRGNENSEIRLPLKPNSRLDGIASNILCTGNELRIRKKNESVASEIENVFKTEIGRNEDRYCSKNWTLVRFFSTFYRYEPKFSKHSKEEIRNLEERYKII
ncbi:MAG: hypothetical protein H8Z69_02170 [Nanohaloarchaea archaeon]|nr:hypothetical protein [Candidatus Nanohaloarchaea archaeon]